MTDHQFQQTWRWTLALTILGVLFWTVTDIPVLPKIEVGTGRVGL